MTDVARAAAALGIEPGYFDAWGTWRTVDHEALAFIVAALGGARNEAPGTAVSVVRRGRPAPDLALPFAATGWRLSTDGKVVAAGVPDPGGLGLPADLAIGHYRLDVTGREGESASVQVLVAPETCFVPPFVTRGEKHWALAVQLYGVRSQRNWGHGDFTDLAALIRMAAKAGAAAIALNPLHALFEDRAEQASPYAPNSRVFLNPLYIDVDAVEEFAGADPRLAEELVRLRAAPLVDYVGVAAAKRHALRTAYETFRHRAKAARRADFAAFCEERGSALAHFAAFEVLRRRFHAPWWEWPPEWREPREDAIARLRRREPDAVAYHEFVQWIADRQLRACRDEAHALGMPVGLYLDFAVGVDAGGADAWSDQRGFVRTLSIGAPPDLLNREGQDWGLACFNPRMLAATGFDAFRAGLRATMRHAGALRIDHVLGFNRVFVVPHGFGATRGTYVRFPLEAMLAVTAQESVAARCLVIGEDLGTVPDGLRETLADWKLWSYRVALFERGHDGAFNPPESYPREALVTFSTHDLPTYAGWWSGHDLAVKRAIGLDPGESDAERGAARAAFAAAFGDASSGETPPFGRVAGTLARAPSGLLAIALEDVFGVEDQPNVPGTTDAHPNWRRRLPVALEDFAADGRLSGIASALAAAGRGDNATKAPRPVAAGRASAL